MKNSLLLLCFPILPLEAAIWQIDLGPEVFLDGPQPGLFGIHSGNTTPDSGSIAAGKEIQGSNGNFINYNDETKNLELHLGWGWGSSVGGYELQNTFSALSIRGPASLGSNAGLLYTFGRGSAGLTDDGFDYASATFHSTFQLQANPNGSTWSVAQQEAQLFADEWYITVDTDAFPQGEIRGQMLVAIPESDYFPAIFVGGLAAFAVYRGRKKIKSSDCAINVNE